MADETAYFEFFGGFNVEGGIEGHFEVSSVVGREESHQGLLED